MKLKNKKAIVLPETLKIIIAVLCIIILIYLSVQLYNLFLRKTEIEQARETLKQIVDKIEDLEKGEETSYLVVAPKDWYLVAYAEGEVSPSQCKGKNCLCVCPTHKTGLEEIPYNIESTENSDGNYFFKTGSEGGLTKCEKEGICEIFDKPVQINQLHIPPAGGKIISKKGDWGKAYSVNWISLAGVPLKIYLKKGENIIFSIYPSEQEIIDGLLDKKIKFDNKEILFREFVIEYFGGNCEKGFLPEDEAIRKIEEETEDYIESLKKQGKISGGIISYYLIEGDKIIESVEVRKTVRGTIHLGIDEENLCYKDSALYVTFSRQD